MDQDKRQLQFSLKTVFLFVFAFALGFVTRNLASGLPPFMMRLGLPASTSPIVPGDVLLIESMMDKSLNRRVTVLADGTVSLPLVGTVSIDGRNIAAVEKTLVKSYSQFYKDPGLQVYRADASEPLK